MTNHEPYFELGMMISSTGDAQKAFEYFELSFSAGNRSIALLSELAAGYLTLGKNDKALYFNELIAESSEDSSVIANAKEQITALRTRVGVDVVTDSDISNKAENLENISENKPEIGFTVENAIANAPSTDKDSVRLTMMLTLGIMHYRNGDLEDSEEALVKTISDAKKCANHWIEALAEHSLALVKTAFGDIRGAIDAYLRAAELAPNQITPWNKVGALYEDLDQVDEAFDAYYRSIACNPEDPESWNGIGDLLTRGGKFDEAIACYQLGNVFDRNSYGTDGIKVYEKALVYYKQVIERSKSLPQAPAIDATQPTKSMEIGHVEPAKNKTVEETQPTQATPIADEELIPIPLGLSEHTPVCEIETTSAQLDENVEATIRRFETTVKENPFNDRAWDSLGNIYKRNRMIDKAIFAYENAVGIQPTKKIYHYQLGTLYAVDGNFPSAISEMEKVLEQEPRSVYAHCALANYYRRLGKKQQASHHIEIASPSMKNEKEYDRACFESVRGNNDLAISFLQAAISKNQVTLDVVENDLDLDFIRDDPRFDTVIRDAKRSEAYH